MIDLLWVALALVGGLVVGAGLGVAYVNNGLNSLAQRKAAEARLLLEEARSQQKELYFRPKMRPCDCGMTLRQSCASLARACRSRRSACSERRRTSTVSSRGWSVGSDSSRTASDRSSSCTRRPIG